MADLIKKQYLDLAGLKAFWGIIKDKFVSEVTMSDITADGVAFTAKDGLGNETAIGVIPMATSTQAGLMSAAQAKTVDEFSEGVAALVPFTDLKVKGTSATLADRAANIDFVYDSDNKKINVVDLNNDSAVLTSIDATAFIKDGMIDSVAFDTEDNPNDLVITFNTDAGKEAIILPLDKLVDVYTGGNGISVDGKVISVKLADTYLAADTTGLKVADALWTKVGELDTAVANAAAADAKAKADAAQAAAIVEAGKLAAAAQEAAEGKAAELAGNAETNAKKYTDDRLGDLGKVDEADQTVKGYVDAAIAEVVGANGSLADVLQGAKDYTDDLIGKKADGETPATGIYADIDAAAQDAKDYADGLINGEGGVDSRLDALEADTHKHDNKTVLDDITAEKVDAWDAAQGNAKEYTDALIGGALAGEGETKTVKGYVDAAQKAAEDYADAAAKAAYAAIEAIPVADITLDKLDA